MFARKLQALQHFNATSFDHNDEKQFRGLVLWLEDQKIRNYKVEDRAGLRDTESPLWYKSFGKYLESLECPYTVKTERPIVVDWLLSVAVRNDYNDNVDELRDLTAEKLAQLSLSDRPVTSCANPLDNLNFDEPDFKKGVATIASMLQLPRHPDHLVTLAAISKLVQERLSLKVVKTLQEAGYKAPEGDHYKLEQFTIGFKTGDNVLDNAARILRLLHVQELRELQTKINEAIVTMQRLTANPKTDDRLGKVGRT
jgi:RLL motif-containing protein 1